MDAAFLRMKLRIQNRSGFLACANGPRCSEANSPSLAAPALAPPSRSEFPSPGISGPVKHSPMKILIADDHAVVRHGLRQILADDFKRATFGEARNAQEALDLVWKENWDVVVLDITMPGRSGLDVL